MSQTIEKLIAAKGAAAVYAERDSLWSEVQAAGEARTKKEAVAMIEEAALKILQAASAARTAERAAAAKARRAKKLGIEGWENGQPVEGLLKLQAPDWASEKAYGFDFIVEISGVEVRARAFLPKSQIVNGCAPNWLVERAEAEAIARLPAGDKIYYGIEA